MSDVFELPDEHVFDNSDAPQGTSIYFFLAGIGLLVLAIVAFIANIATRQSQMSLHLTTTLPTILAVALLAQAFSMRSLPTLIIVGPNALEITTRQWARKYAWSEIGSAAITNVLNSHQSCLHITNTAGKTIIRIDESFPDFPRLVKLIESFIDAKPDDTSLRIMSRKAMRAGLSCFVFGCLLATASVFIAITTRAEQRANQLLPAKGVQGEAEIVRRFVAPNGVTKRLEYRVAGASVKNVEMDPVSWEELANAKTVRVRYVPDEPEISRLELGEIKEDDFTKTPFGGYLFSGLAGLMSLVVLALSPLAWMGYDLAYDDKQRVWKLKRYGRVIWASKKEAVEDA